MEKKLKPPSEITDKELQTIRRQIDEGIALYNELDIFFRGKNLATLAVCVALSKLTLDKIAPGLVDQSLLILKDNLKSVPTLTTEVVN